VYLAFNAKSVFNWSLIMSPLELAYRAALRAVPNFRFGHDQLVRLLSALPPPPADAPVAFRHRLIRGIIEEVRALDTVNPLEAMLVAQIMASRHAAADCVHRSRSDAVGARCGAAVSLHGDCWSGRPGRRSAC
jgi:hypothetical protein